MNVGTTIRSAALYGENAVRVLARSRRKPAEERLVFVVGSPRSGTTMLAQTLGAQPGLVDLGEVKPLKAAIPRLARLPEDEAAHELRLILDRVRTLSLVRRLRAVEQTPETAYVLRAALRAYPRARAVHIVRDGRDVVCSLLERGWLSAGREGHDDAGLSFGSYVRFWVEPERAADFARASDATRAAWAWRRYVTAASAVSDRTLVVRYEELVGDREAAAEVLGAHFALDPPLLAASLARAHDQSVGRWRRDLSSEQVEDVMREAGETLRELGYTD